MTWQPMETAPMDGTWIILAGGSVGYGHDAEPHPPMVVGQCTNIDLGLAFGWSFASYDGGYYGEYEHPTHWMPLPEPPK